MNKLPIYKKITGSGAELIFIKKNDTPITNLLLLYKVGSKNEPEGMHGFAHLFEHLMFEGSKNYPKGMYDSICAKNGGTNNAYTTYDWTMYYMILPKNSIEIGLQLEADRLYNLNLTQEALENQQSVVTEEIKQVVFNQPYGQWRDIQAKTAYPKNNSYNWEVHGLIEDVQNATLKKCEDFHNYYYVPENMKIVITGDYEEEEIFKIVNNHFDKKKPRKEIEIPNYDYSMKNSGVGSYEDDVPYDAAFVSFHIPEFLNDELLIGDVVASIAGKGKSSVLYHNLMYERQKVSEVGAYIDRREKNSLITFYAIANTSEDSAEYLNDLLWEQVEILKKKSVIEEKFEKSKNQIKMTLANNLLTGYGLSEAIALNNAFYGKPERTYELIDLYSEISIDETVEFCNKYFRKENSVATYVKQKG